MKLWFGKAAAVTRHPDGANAAPPLKIQNTTRLDETQPHHASFEDWRWAMRQFDGGSVLRDDDPSAQIIRPPIPRV